MFHPWPHRWSFGSSPAALSGPIPKAPGFAGGYLLGPPDREFHLYGFRGYYVVQRRFAKFRIVLLVSYISLPAFDHAFINHRVTLRDDPDASPERSFEIRESWKGRDEYHCAAEYLVWRSETLAGHIKFIDYPDKEELFRLGQFFTYASMTT